MGILFYREGRDGLIMKHLKKYLYAGELFACFTTN
jgi:hypothetical protein